MIAYKITNKINGMLYIGMTSKPLEQRWRSHQTWARGNKPYALHQAIKEFGPENFVIEHIASAKSFSDLKLLEKQLVVQYGCLYPHGYNKTLGGQGVLGYRHTEECKQLLSAQRKSAGPIAISKDAIERARVARIGQKRTAEQKKHISLARKGKGLLNCGARKYPKETLELAMKLLISGEKPAAVVKLTGLSQSYVSNLKTGKRGATI